MEIISDINIESNLWTKDFPNILEQTNNICEEIFKNIPESNKIKQIEISFLLTDDANIKIINREFRKKDKATNVLSFPSGEYAGNFNSKEDRLFLGDIALAFETIKKEAQLEDKKFIDHFTHMLVHGILHLLGHDHEKIDEAEKMEALEINILASMGINDPYINCE